MEATLNEIDVADIQAGSAEEASLIKACQEGDQTAFNLLVWRWEKPLFNFTYKYVGDAHLAQDLVQETFLRVHKSIHRYEHRSALSTWMYQIAVNLCRDHFRRKKLPTISLQDYYTTSAGDQVFVEERVPDETPISDEAMATSQRQELIRRLITGLPEDLKVVVLMKEYQGLTFREISEIVEEPLGTVKARLYRALKIMRGQLKREGITDSGSGGM